MSVEGHHLDSASPDPQGQKQLNKLRPIASYDDKTKMWHARLGALDLADLEMLQTLFGAARVHGTEVCLAPVAVPAYWNGLTFTGDPKVVALLQAQAARERPFGQLPLV